MKDNEVKGLRAASPMHFGAGMKRIFLPLASMFSLLACVSATDSTSAPITFDGQSDASDVLPADAESGEEGEEDADRNDAVDRVTPIDAFPTVAAFCVEQEKMMERASHLLRAAEERIRGTEDQDEENDSEVRFAPHCEENRAVLSQTATFLSDPVRDVSAVSYEVGEAIETRLIVKLDRGWVVADDPLLQDIHWEGWRMDEWHAESIAEVHVETARDGAPALAVTTREVILRDEMHKEVARLLRACDLSDTARGIRCGAAVTIDRTLFSEQEDITPTVLFATDYELADALTAVPEEMDESREYDDCPE